MGEVAGDPTRPFDLLVVGEVNPDVIVADPDPQPAFGQAERIVQDIRLAVGSSSVIMACAHRSMSRRFVPTALRLFSVCRMCATRAPAGTRKACAFGQHRFALINAARVSRSDQCYEP